MAGRYSEVTQLAARSALDMTKRRGNWERFLDTAARLYKYPFPDQLAIYAQRPDATACAPIETWNTPFGRFVRRGSKGIALIDDSGQYPRLKYVFDVSDTEPGRPGARNINMWEMRPEYEGPVMDALAGSYGAFEGSLSDVVFNVALSLAGEYYNENARDIVYSVEGSFLEDLDEYNIGAAFRESAAVSAAYCVMTRCGLNAGDYFKDEDFQNVIDFNTESAVYTLGTAVSEISERVLREIEVTVKNMERQMAASRTPDVERGVDNGRNDGTHIQRVRGLPAAGSDGGRGAGAAQAVRDNAPELSQTAPDNLIQLHAAERDFARTPAGDTGGSGKPDGVNDDVVVGEEPAAGQRNRSNGLGRPYEQPAADSRGSGQGRTDLQLDRRTAEQSEAGTDNRAHNDETPPRQGNTPEPGGVFTPARYKYYSTQRPVDIGTYPRDSGNPVEIFNYDRRTWVENETIRAWGYLIYDTPLTETQISDYELRAAPDNPAIEINEAESETYSQLGNTFNVPPIKDETAKVPEIVVGAPEGLPSASGSLTVPETTITESTVPETMTELDTPDNPVQTETETVSLTSIQSQVSGEAEYSDTPIIINTESHEIIQPTAQAITPSILGGVTISAVLAVTRTPITIGEIDMVLRDGGNADGSLYRITAFYMKDKGDAANTDFLARELYGGRYGSMGPTGKGFQTGDIQLSVWYGKDGIALNRGKAARYERGSVHIPWEQAAARVGELLEAGQFAPPEVLGGAIGNEYRELAERLVSFYRDTVDKWEDLPDGWYTGVGGVPAIEENVAGFLADPVKRIEIAERLEADVSAFLREHTQVRNDYHNPERLLAGIRDTLPPLRQFPVAELPEPIFTRFITEDEVDQFFTRGGPYTEGKFRTLSFFLQNPSPKEQANFIKAEYGNSGQSDALGTDDSWFDGMRDGIKLTRGNISEPYSTFTLKWQQAAARVGKLIETGRYMANDELNRILEYERIILARQINGFSHWPDKTGRPFREGINLTYPREDDHQAVREFLNDRARLDATLAVMTAGLEGVDAGDSHYAYDKKAFDTLTKYANGTYTLFPGLERIRQPETREALVNSSFIPPISPSATGTQLSLFDMPADIFTPTANFPSIHDQREKITESIAAEQTAQQSVPDITDTEVRAVLTASVENPETREKLRRQFMEAPRSRESARLLREVYSHIEFTMPRIDGTPGYLGVLYEPGGGVSLVKGEPGTVPVSERLPAAALTLTWTKLQQYVAAIVEDGGFLTRDEQAPLDQFFAWRDEQGTEGRQNESGTETYSQLGNTPETGPAFTEDEISALLLTVAAEPETRKSLHRQFTDAPRSRDAARLLREIYGRAEVSLPRTDGRPGHMWFFYDGGGFELVKSATDKREPLSVSPAETFSMTWAGLQQRIATLAADGRFAELTQQELSPGIAGSEPIAAARDEEYAQPYVTSDRDQEIAPDTARSEPAVSIADEVKELMLQEGFAVSDELIAYAMDSLGGGHTAFDVAERLTMIMEQEEAESRGVNEPGDPDETGAGQQKPETRAQSEIKPGNFHITDERLGEGGPKTKYGYNIAAIRTLKQVEAEGRHATREEQEVLSRFVGWGGIPQAFDAKNGSWAKEYAELRELLTPDEYEMARASTLNAHYTTPVVITAMYETLERVGFRGGNILEPSCGVGNFFGLLPRGMSRSKLYGVELDGISGRIASMLYPGADIQVAGFEQTDMPDAFFDAVIGNVPFGDYPVSDPKYRQNFSIHEYFFAKALDQVRPGGVVAFVSSKFLMDRKNPSVRKYIAQRAELLGAVRLPNDAFLKNAGTETTTDIIFLQRRDRPIDIEADWTRLSYTAGNIPVNAYFAEHPEMILGRMAPDEKMNGKYGGETETTCLPIPGKDLGELLHGALSTITGQISEPEVDSIENAGDASVPADLSVRNFSYAMLDGAVYFRENSRMYPIEATGPDFERIAGMIALRDCCRELIALQLDEHDDSEIREKQAEMNALYDGFTGEYGLLNNMENARAFDGDSSYYLLCSLEILDDDGNFERKADMFSRRTIKRQTQVTSVDTSTEALAVSIGQKAKVDIGYMVSLTGFTPERIINDLEGVIFCDIGNPNRSLPEFNPESMKIYEKFPPVTADEYLSGNVREKLRKAKAFQEAVGDTFYGVNVALNVHALEQAQPADLEAGDISARLGATWIDKSYVQQFMYELLQSPYNIRSVAKVNYFEYTGEWQVTGINRIPPSNVLACVTFGTKRANAYKIIEDTLNLRDVRIYDIKEDPDGKERRVLNRDETTIAQQRQELIRQKFKDWIWQDPNRRRTLVTLYNERFNSTRPREYDGSHIMFAGMNTDITMRSHQRAAVARVIYGGNALLAHDVGAGKTFEMAAAAMEMKRLGLCQKSLIAVPNHLPGDFAAEFLRLYPSANILVVNKKDFEMKNRRKFCARIATGDYDAIIIGHSQIEKIPISGARQERLIREQVEEITAGIGELKDNGGERFSIKQLERAKKRLMARLDRLVNAKPRDDVVSFEQLGVDRLFVDESHNYKNLFLYTKMRNVAGLSTADAQKSSDLFQKCRYLDELTGGKGVIFATGTPVSNSMTEMYSMQRYLQYDSLRQSGLAHFDAWASAFGETRTSIELAPEGSGYRARTRFARFENLPELMAMFKETADIKTADMMNIPCPNANYHTIVADPTAVQKEMVAALSERAARIHSGGVDPSQDNILKIITDGRKIGLDQRLANPLLPDDPKSKVNLCAENITRIWGETREQRLTQLLFCDYSTPKSNIWVADKKSTKPYSEQMRGVAGRYLTMNSNVAFNVYDDLKAKLILRGIPPQEIAFIHEADTDEQKQALFAKVRKGLVRVLFGSTPKVGVGTNVQDKLIALHDLDCPWRPADLQQRAGRIVRFGNSNPEVDIYRYVTNGTFDSYLWQTLENKQRFISQIMTGKSPVRVCEDVDEIMFSYAEIKAMCAGDPRIKEKMDLDLEVARLRLIKSEHQNTHFRLQDDLIKHFPESIEAAKGRIAGYEADIRLLEKSVTQPIAVEPKASELTIFTNAAEQAGTTKQPAGETAPSAMSMTAVATPAKLETTFQPMTILGKTYIDREEAGNALLAALGEAKGKEQVSIGSYRGFDMRLSFDSFDRKHILTLKGSMSHNTELGGNAGGNITRINNTMADIPERLKSVKAQLDNLYQQVDNARAELKRPFAQEAELAGKEERLAALNVELNIDGRVGHVIDSGTPEQPAEQERDIDVSAKRVKPSVLEGLRTGIYDGKQIKAITGMDKAKPKELSL